MVYALYFFFPKGGQFRAPNSPGCGGSAMPWPPQPGPAPPPTAGPRAHSGRCRGCAPAQVVIDVEEEELQLPAPYGSIWRRLGDAQAKKRPQPALEPAKSYWGKWKRSLANAW